MKKSIWLLPVALILCAALFILYIVRDARMEDSIPPVLTFDSQELTLSVHDDRSALLSGLSALDDRDGDVTHLVLVEGVSAIGSNRRATVTYAAFDHSGNVTKGERTVFYQDYEGPKFAFSQPLLFRSGLSFNLFDYITATDPLDGDLTNRIKATMVEGDSDISQVGIHQVELRVTNSMGDIARITVPVEVYSAGDYTASVQLTQSLVYLKMGTIFDPSIYLDTFQMGYTELPIDSSMSLRVDSNVNTARAGTYEVTYTVSYNNYTGFTRLIVIVEE